METLKPLLLTLFGYTIEIPMSYLVMWIITAIIVVLAIIATRRLEKIPNRKQNIVEMIVESINNLVKNNMGERYTAYIPYVGTLVVFILLMNLVGLIGIEPPTKDYNIALGLAIITFFVVQINAIKKNGMGHYLKGYLHPFAFLLPLNIVERFVLPMSLSLRLFGNMTAAVVVIDLIYNGLSKIAWIAQIGIPVPVHAFFDVFDGGMQMFIFVMLTMVNIKVIEEH